MQIATRVTGLAELEEKLRALPRAVAGDILMAGMMEGGAVLQAAVRARAPVRKSGGLKGAKTISRAVMQRIARRTVREGRVRLTRAEHRHIASVRAGRAGGFLKASIVVVRGRDKRTGKPAVNVGIGRAFYGSFLERGTTRAAARKFLEPAARASQAAVTRAFTTYVNAAIEALAGGRFIGLGRRVR